MKIDNPLDKHLDANNKLPGDLRPPICDVADTLDLAWMATQAVFEDRATTELAVMVFDRLISRLQRQWSLDEAPQAQS